jgi:CheY-like chemotaxis protein
MARVLIVDDEAIITMQLGEKIGSMGHKVVGMVSSGEAAIAKASETKPDIVLMDIVMPGAVNGIAAAKVIRRELDIPVVFITSYADDKTLADVKKVNPYGYIVKPFNDLELKATVELALFRKKQEEKEGGKRGYQKMLITDITVSGDGNGDTAEPDGSLPPESKTVLLNNFYQGIILVLYTSPQTNEAIFKTSIEYGLANGHCIFYAYHHSPILKHFHKEVQEGKIFPHRLKQGELHTVIPAIETHCTALQERTRKWQILMDFSDVGDSAEIGAIKEHILTMTPEDAPVSGIVAMNIGRLNHEQIESASAGIAKVIISTGNETSVSIADHSYPLASLSVVPQAIVEEIVRKSLEPLVLSILNRPMSGYDIIHEIHNRHNVLIPQSRIYTILYGLETQGVLTQKASGKAKLYVPTEQGEAYIRQRVNEYTYTFQHIFGGGAHESKGISSTK